MHFPDEAFYACEIMAPRRGGTIVPKIAEQELLNKPLQEKELPPMKASPLTRAAIRWVYNPDARLSNVSGLPVYCRACKVLGWHFS